MVSYIECKYTRSNFLDPPVKVDTYLADLREQEVCQESTKNAQRTGDEERILALTNGVGGILLDNWHNVGAHECTNLSNGGSIRVVLTTDGSGATLGCAEAKVIARAKLAQRKEDAIAGQKPLHNNQWLLVRCNVPVDHNETAHVRGGRKPLVASRHDKPDDPLEKNSESESVTRT
jgi:hypothetical protein